METRYVTSPDNRYEGLSWDFSYHDDGSVDVIGSIKEFQRYLQANYDQEYARPHRPTALLVGAPLLEAPWAYDLSIDEYGNMCDGNIYVYSYEGFQAYDDMNEGTECNVVYDRDGSMGHHRTYGPYAGTNVSISVMRTGEGCVPTPSPPLPPPPCACLHATLAWTHLPVIAEHHTSPA